MVKLLKPKSIIQINISEKLISTSKKAVLYIMASFIPILSILSFIIYLKNGLGLSYNDARSHLDIGRRVVEGLKPGLAQLGSVWLPLPHLLMVPFIWNDFMWHSGLAGALQSMISYVATSIVIYLFLKRLKVGYLGRIMGVLIFALNPNILYLQSIAMTELLLIATMTAAAYKLLAWFQEDNLLDLIQASFWIMLATLVRYDGWFLLLIAVLLVGLRTLVKKGYQTTEGTIILFCTFAGFGIFLWLLWNQLIFKDALYFIFGPYSARAQQVQLEKAGNLITKGNLFMSLKIYLHALIYNSNAFISILGLIGALVLWLNKKINWQIKICSIALFVPFIFNVIALFFGHSVLFIQGISGNTWFNVRYGAMMMPSIAIFVGYLIHKAKDLRWTLIGLIAMVMFFALVNNDAVTIDDARVGSSQKNVTEVSGWLKDHAANQKGFVLISAASHDAIIFSSGMPMKRFIHEGTGMYWENATNMPDRWARWIVMRTHDQNDMTFKAMSQLKNFDQLYQLVNSYPFADIYELKSEYLGNLQTEPVLGKQK